MPNRYIRASAIESEAVNALTPAAEVFWRRLMNRVDDYGRFTANPSLLRATLYPLQLNKVSEAAITANLKACADVGLLFLYEINGKQLLVMNKWEQGRATKSDYAPPPENICLQMKTYVYSRKHKHADAPDSDSDSDPGSDSNPDTDKGGKFVPPLPHEVEQYALSIGWPMDGQAWCDSYVQKGWAVGKGKMKDWRAAVRNWKANKWKPTAQSNTKELREDLNRF